MASTDTKTVADKGKTDPKPTTDTISVDKSTIDKPKCDPAWFITLKNGDCQSCPYYTRPQNQGSVCEPDKCLSDQYITQWGYCEQCPSGWVVNDTGKGC